MYHLMLIGKGIPKESFWTSYFFWTSSKEVLQTFLVCPTACKDDIYWWKAFTYSSGYYGYCKAAVGCLVKYGKLCDNLWKNKTNYVINGGNRDTKVNGSICELKTPCISKINNRESLPNQMQRCSASHESFQEVYYSLVRTFLLPIFATI